MSDHHDLVTQRRDLLHDVTRKQQAVAFVSQPHQQFAAAGTPGHGRPGRWWNQLVGQYIPRAMDDGARECGFHSLPLRKSLRDSIRKLAHLQELDELSGPGFAFLAGQSVKGAEVQNILAGG